MRVEYLTIGQVSKKYDVTPRMLRHYEKLGLIEAIRKDDNAYRVYDENAVSRLRRIIILRKLRIPLKQIDVILRDNDRQKALSILRDNIEELDAEITSMDRIRGTLKAFSRRLDSCIEENKPFDMLEDSELSQVADSLSFSKAAFKENTGGKERVSDDEILNRNLNVRIIRQPPFTVASYHFIGDNPEDATVTVVSEFVKNSRLYEIKPDSRMFGFNNPIHGVLEGDIHGYETQVTIPDDMEVPEPLVRKRVESGLYAVLTIKWGEFQYWSYFWHWLINNPVYEADQSRITENIGCPEEYLNWVYFCHMSCAEARFESQMDLMIPIKRRAGGG